MPDRPFEVSRCTRCNEELTAISRCEKDGHRSHHAQCCPASPPPASPPPARPAGLLRALRSRR